MMDSNTAANDFEYARQVYHDLLAKGSESMEEMMEVARATEHPRAFEVLSNMMKNIAMEILNMVWHLLTLVEYVLEVIRYIIN